MLKEVCNCERETTKKPKHASLSEHKNIIYKTQVEKELNTPTIGWRGLGQRAFGWPKTLRSLTSFHSSLHLLKPVG